MTPSLSQNSRLGTKLKRVSFCAGTLLKGTCARVPGDKQMREHHKRELAPPLAKLAKAEELLGQVWVNDLPGAAVIIILQHLHEKYFTAGFRGVRHHI